MLSLEDIKGEASTEEAAITVESWGGDVRIRELTVAEQRSVVALQSSGDPVGAMVKMVSCALVEPKMTEKQLNALSGKALEGIREVADAAGNLAQGS